MLAVMVIFAAVWTVAEVVANVRWIEVGAPGDYSLAPPALAFGAFAWDVVAEIGLMYVPFLAIPHIFGAIKTKKELAGPPARIN
jgi:hypothetical protein